MSSYFAWIDIFFDHSTLLIYFTFSPGMVKSKGFKRPYTRNINTLDEEFFH